MVVRQSFALTLYVFWHLTQLDRTERFAEQHGYFMLATALAFATHEPKELPAIRRDFERDNSPPVDPGDRMARVRKMLDDHRRMQLIDPPS